MTTQSDDSSRPEFDPARAFEMPSADKASGYQGPRAVTDLVGINQDDRNYIADFVELLETDGPISGNSMVIYGKESALRKCMVAEDIAKRAGLGSKVIYLFDLVGNPNTVNGSRGIFNRLNQKTDKGFYKGLIFLEGIGNLSRSAWEENGLEQGRQLASALARFMKERPGIVILGDSASKKEVPLPLKDEDVFGSETFMKINFPNLTSRIEIFRDIISIILLNTLNESKDGIVATFEGDVDYEGLAEESKGLSYEEIVDLFSLCIEPTGSNDLPVITNKKLLEAIYKFR